jgi:hypothetical protein
MVVHTYNLTYSGGKNQEDYSPKMALGKNRRPYLKKG